MSTTTAVRTPDTHDRPATSTTHRRRSRNTRRTLRLVTGSTSVPQPRAVPDDAVRLHPVDLGPWDD